MARRSDQAVCAVQQASVLLAECIESTRLSGRTPCPKATCKVSGHGSFLCYRLHKAALSSQPRTQPN